MPKSAGKIRALVNALSVVLLLSTLSAAPKLVEANRALAQSPQAFEPSLEPNHFVTHAGVRISPGVLSMGPHSMRLMGADPRARGVGEDPLPGKTNYFIGNDPGRWRTNVPNYRRIRYHNVYPGIDVLYYGSARDVEFDFVLAPGADPGRIQLVMSGPELKLREPKVYQGERLVEARAARQHNRVTFELASYDHSRPLTIDPVIGFAALLGDAGVDNGVAIAVDRSGATYVTGNFFGLNGVTQNGAVPHAFVAKLSADGSTVLYNTYLASTGQDSEFGYAIAVDAAGNAFVTGKTFSTTFPVVNPAQRSPGGGGDAFVVKLSPDGSTLLYSTYLGGKGPDYGSGIALDSAGNAYVTGTTFTDDFPTRNAFQSKAGGRLDAFVTKYSASGAMVYSTYFGGATDDGGLAIAVDSAGSVYLTGYTWSLDFPVKDAVKPVNPGGGDAFIAKFTPDGSSLVWSTFLGGTGFEQGNGIAVDPNGNVYVAGTTSSRDFPTVSALQPATGSAVLRKSLDGAATFAPSDAGLPGTVSALAIDPRNGSNLYAGVGQIGVYKSTDAGLTWSKVLDAAKNDYFSNLAIDPSSPSTVYAGSQSLISKTTDGGATWKSIKYGGASVLTLAVNPDDGSVYAGSGGGNSADGLYYSSDSGDTWRRPSLGGPGKAIKAFAIAASNPSILYVNCGNQIYKSAGGGGSFTLLTTAFFPLQIPGALLVDPSNSMLVYAAGNPQGPSNGARIYKSTDGGQSWSDTDFSPMPLAGFGNQPAYVNFSALAMDAGTGSIYVATSAGLFKTTDGFVHFTLVNASANLYDLAVSASAPGTLYAATPASRDGFVAKLSADGKSYQYVTYLGGSGDDGANSIAVDAVGNAYVAGSTLSGDFPTKNAFVNRTALGDGFMAKLAADGATLVYSSYVGASVSGLALNASGAVYLTGSWSRPDFFSDSPLLPYHKDTSFRTDDGASHWSGAVFPNGGYIGYLAPDPRVSNRVFALGGIGVYRSLDAGRNWTLVLQPNSGPGSIAIDPVNTGTLWLSQPSSVQKSSDGGDNWHVTKGLPNGGGPSIVVDPRNPAILYLSTYSGLFNANVPALYKSNDGGENWTSLAFRPPTLGPGPPIQNLLAVDSQSNVYILSGTSNATKLFKSSDGGTTFAQLSGVPSATLIVVDPVTPSVVYVGGGTGLFRSTDGGASFAKIYDGFIRSVAVDPNAPATLYLSGQNPGVLKSTDRGASWHSTGLSIPYVNLIAVDTLNPGRVYAGTAIDPADVFVIKVVE